MTTSIKYYNQTILPSENGIITSSIQDDLIEENTFVTYTFTSNDGCSLKEVKINGNTVSLDNNQYTISDVQENIDVEAVFEKTVLKLIKMLYQLSSKWLKMLI